MTSTNLRGGAADGEVDSTRYARRLTTRTGARMGIANGRMWGMTSTNLCQSSLVVCCAMSMTTKAGRHEVTLHNPTGLHHVQAECALSCSARSEFHNRQKYIIAFRATIFSFCTPPAAAALCGRW